MAAVQTVGDTMATTPFALLKRMVRELLSSSRQQ